MSFSKNVLVNSIDTTPQVCISLSFFPELIGFFDRLTIKGFYSFGKTITDKEESEADEFIKEWALMMEGERTMS